MGSIHAFTTILDTINEPELLDSASHSQNSSETSDTLTASQISADMEDESSNELSVFSTGTYDGSCEVSDESFARADTPIPPATASVYHDSGEASEANTSSDESFVMPVSTRPRAIVSGEASQVIAASGEVAESTALFGETFQIIAGSGEPSQSTSVSDEASEETAASQEAAAASDESRHEIDSEDEFPEISELKNLFQLFETCPLTETEKDLLYDKLVSNLYEDRIKLTEMEEQYERRVQFIKEFETARKASEQPKTNTACTSRNCAMNRALRDAMTENDENIQAETEYPNAEDAVPTPPQNPKSKSQKRKIRRGKGAAAARKRANQRATGPIQPPQKIVPQAEEATPGGSNVQAPANTNPQPGPSSAPANANPQPGPSSAPVNTNPQPGSSSAPDNTNPRGAEASAILQEIQTTTMNLSK